MGLTSIKIQQEGLKHFQPIDHYLTVQRQSQCLVIVD